ncbi:MAG: hypothetical protein K8T26_18840 [Lentisphaerae bacterium]|nr:hypothetical protein [Lentisphaerota bacterium]
MLDERITSAGADGLPPAAALTAFVERLMPRLLSQVCRDPQESAYGCFDRDWWHYKIRDFPSIILQQGGYTAWLAGRLAWGEDQAAGLSALAAASCRFWAARAVRRGAFEEYYPFEAGYPPLAFSTLAVMKLAAAGVVPAADIRAGAGVAAEQLTARFESEAANQQVAGAAALAWLRRVFPDLVTEEALAVVVRRTLALQTAEGWFPEYGGPDLGYLSVTLDCLWDLSDALGPAAPHGVARPPQEDAGPTVRAIRDAIDGAVDCLVRYGALFGSSIGMHNARNTDYLLPYGLTRCVQAGGGRGRAAARLLTALYARVGDPSHVVHAMDDRYLSHYAGHSLVRAALALRDQPWPAAGVDAGPPVDALYDLSGHYLRHRQPDDCYGVILSLRKGGILTASDGARRVSDLGWVVQVGADEFVSHWWSAAWQWTREGRTWCVQGKLVPHREVNSSPLKHVLLRAASFAFGRRLIGPLKRKLIFKGPGSDYGFERRITLEPARIVVADRITGLPSGAQVRAAPRASKRHVASADTYHGEDLAPARGVVPERTTRFEHGVFEATTVYRFD